MNQPEQMWDLKIERLSDGHIDLEQSCGSGELASINLHPAQVAVISRLAGVQAGEGRPPAWREKTIRRLVGHLNELGEGYLSEILERCGSGVEISMLLRSMRTLADDLIEDLDKEACDTDEPTDV